MKIRQEQISDFANVNTLVKVSFATNADDDGTTHDYLNELRYKKSYIPELSLVVEDENEEIIGHIVLYKTDISTPDGKATELVLSPICVRPDYFRQGVARYMIEVSVEKARDLGFRAVFLCGEPTLYSRLGFVPTYKHDIYHISDKNRKAEWCMVRELVDDALRDISGTIDIV